jgi:ubiquinone biosynthesis protein UbiJ
MQWLKHETQQKLVLCINHILMQEPQAMERLKRHQGKCIKLQWKAPIAPPVTFWQVTPAGLVDMASGDVTPDLDFDITIDDPIQAAKSFLQGEKPPIKVYGDVHFAAEINWLTQHVRWDIEEDLSRLLGDAVAHNIVDVLRKAKEGLQTFVNTYIRKPNAKVKV